MIDAAFRGIRVRSRYQDTALLGARTSTLRRADDVLRELAESV